MTELKKQRIEGDPFGISLAWDGFLVSGLQDSIDEVGHVLAENKRLRLENKRLRLALEEIIQAANLGDGTGTANLGGGTGTWAVIPRYLIERARAALENQP
jgi:hypothetical protein